jgi:putative transposase
MPLSLRTNVKSGSRRFPSLIIADDLRTHASHPKADTTRPPGVHLCAQQRQFTHFRAAFRHTRPPEALDRLTPAACYDPSQRKRPTKRPAIEDPDRSEGRDVSAHGGIRWHQHWVNVSHTGVGEDVSREEIDAGVWKVSFEPLTRGRFLERHMPIEEAYGSLQRRRCL